MLTLARRSSPLLPTMSRSSSRLASSLSPLLSTEQVQELAQGGERRVRFLDASWYLDKSRDAKKEFAAERLPGAQFFDIEQISDATSTLPHMLPTPETFEHAMMYLGVENDDTVVVYGGKHCFSPARCWWMFKYFGHDSVHILNGGITKWKSEQREIETGEPQKVVAGAAFKAKPNEALAVSWEDVLEKIGSNTQIVDARGAARFYAKDPEPRPGMRGGHIPGALNVPFGKLVSLDDYSLFRDLAEIKSAFAEANVKTDETSPIITSCGSGVTACMLTFGLHLAGKPLEKAPVYDGSWSEWGLRSDLPLETESK
ncbi:3-mercaptopyruvate sulfurtransferase [Phytophthora cinnamomi]|uniref:3-mercaptopyruvate sulfurtransferase n=1 Tax=Phytophthora cinnamomi TaxID=4785 RepID=UPI003559F56E|nr:3-mercaptopyruvate sulfurtransferase [Phytophthora cinnamomi]